MQVNQNPTLKTTQKVECLYACLVLYILNPPVTLTEETKEWDTCGKISSDRFKCLVFPYAITV